VSYNPLASDLADARSALAQMRDSRSTLDRELRWHAQFDPEKNTTDLREASERHAALLTDLDEAQSRLDDAQRVLVERQNDASLGWSPARWFSKERSAAKLRHAEQVDLVARLVAGHRDVTEQLDEVGRRGSRLEGDLRRYAEVDVAKGSERLAQLDREIALREAAVADLARRKERADERLAPLLNDLHGREHEAARLDRQVEIAEWFQRELNSAANGYERKQIHLRCEHELGRSSPGAVIHELGQQRRVLDRDLEKLRRRIAEEARRSVRDIRAVVIDGNNMCYEGNRFLGLTALIPVCDALSRAHDVTVVFDRSIQTRWRLTERDLAVALPAVKVHVVKSRASADELVLDVAREPYTVVLSNDRFSKYSDKDAVSGDRIIQHDILNGRVSIPDLDIDEPLAR